MSFWHERRCFSCVIAGKHLVRGAKRGGAQEHCSQKDMDRTILGRRILAKSTALVSIIKKKVFLLHFCSWTNEELILLPLIENNKVLLKYIPYLKTILKFIGKILSADRYINNELYVTFSCTGWNSSVEVPIIRNFFCEIYSSKCNLHFITLEKFLLQIDKTMIFFLRNFLCEINLSKWKPHVDTL